MRRKPPAFFAAIVAEAKGLWDDFEAKPQISRPWWQLFRQIQSPRHVLSELLKNADDGGGGECSGLTARGSICVRT